MDTSGALISAKDAAKDWVRSRSNGRETSEIFAVYAASMSSDQLQTFTADTARNRRHRPCRASLVRGGPAEVGALVGGGSGCDGPR